ncbi:MAG: VTT domain-containing protein [Acidobacteriota bacterium]
MIAILIVVAARLLPAREWVDAFQRWIGALGSAGLFVFAGVYVSAALLLGPVWLLTLVAGLTWPLSTALPLVSAASTLAAAIAFLLARHLARARVVAFAARNPTFAAVDRAIAQRGWRIVFLLRLSPLVPYGPSNYLYGVTAMRFWPYVLASWIGMLPVTVLYLTIGAAGRAAIGGRSGRSPWEWAALTAGLAATAVVTVWVARAAKAELEKSRVVASPAAAL